MAIYDPQEYRRFINNRDYLGAANYLSTCPAKDGKAQVIINEQIRNLTIKGEKQAALLESGNEEEQDAYHFINSINGEGTIPHTDDEGRNSNMYGDIYTGLINTLHVNKKVISPGGRNVGGERVDRIRLDFNNSSAYKQYLDILGTTFDDVEDLGVKHSRNNKTGHSYLEIPTNNLKLISFIHNLGQLDNIQSISGNWGTISTRTPSPYTIQGVTSSNIVVDVQQFNFDNIRQAGKLIDLATTAKQELIDRNKTVEDVEDTVLLPYLGQGHANAYNDLQRGLITQQEYKNITENITNFYDNLLARTAFSDKEVYIADDDTKLNDDETSILRLAPKQDRDKIKDILNVAIKDKRVNYGAGIRNGVSGTYIEVSQKINEKGEAVKGDYGKKMTIFVPGLFKSDADAAFNSNTKQMAVKDYADMKRWNYGKFLKDGNYIGHNKEIGDYIQTNDENGNAVKVPISKEQSLQLLNRENIVTGSVNKLLSIIDANGLPIEHSVNGQMIPYDIEEQAQLLSAIGTNDLYPKGVYTDGERLEQQLDIYNTIMKLLSKSIYKQRKED